MPKAKDFDLTNPNCRRAAHGRPLLCPTYAIQDHGLRRILGGVWRDGVPPPVFWVCLAILVEAICAVGLTFNLYTRYMGLMSAGTMVLAAYGTFVTKGIHWMWNFGGIEYIAFWGVASLALAVHAWKEVLKSEQGTDRFTVIGAHA